jgi:hypothetical protein
MRFMLAPLWVSLAGLAQAAGTVNLDAPGALDKLRASNPDHYDRVVAAINAAQLHPCETLPDMLKASIRAEGVRCRGAILMTSFPAKLHFAFTLDRVTYVSNVVQVNLGAGKVQPVPAVSK